MEKPECFNIGEPCSACNDCAYEKDCDPTGTTKDTEFLKRNKHVPDEYILKDIQDTEDEIVQLERQIKGHELIGDKINFITAQAKQNGIKHRKDFIKTLNRLLELRKENQDERTRSTM